MVSNKRPSNKRISIQMERQAYGHMDGRSRNNRAATIEQYHNNRALVIEPTIEQ
jgi:hypothetical protein